MREILFRGKNIDGEWYEGSLIKETYEHPNETISVYKIQENTLGFTDNSFEPAYTSGFDEVVYPETVGQYTGLLDKNGKKIFEGDIVKVTTRLHYRTSCVEYYDVSWDDMHYGWQPFVWGCGHCDPLADVEKSEVVGNIHDNNLEDFADYFIDHTKGEKDDA